MTRELNRESYIEEISPLANFVRNASYQEKLAVFTQALKTAAIEQQKVIEQAAAMR